MPSVVTWRGRRFDPRTADMLAEVARLTPRLPTLTPTQGSYNTSVGASAGTHAGGGAVDLSVRTLSRAQELEVIRVMRTVGFAAWVRPELWRGKTRVWVRHIHGIAVGQPDLSPAAARQVTALRNGRDGLAANGPDPHASLGLPVTTWETYLKTREKETRMSFSTQIKSIVRGGTERAELAIARGRRDAQRTVRALFYSGKSNKANRYAQAVGVRSIDNPMYPGTEANPESAKPEKNRRRASWRYAIERTWRWAYWAYRRIVAVDERTDRIEAKLDALIAAWPDTTTQEARIKAAVEMALAEHDRRLVQVDINVLSEDDPTDDQDDDSDAGESDDGGGVEETG